jgi:chromate reductase
MALASANAVEEVQDMSNVITICGSLRKGSFNRMLANLLPGLAPAGMTITPSPSIEMPLYNSDLQAEGFPPAATALAEAIRAADGVIIVSPEYNWTIPGGLKNAIDWASRPWGQNSFARKPSAMIGTSPGKIGTAVGQQHLKSILSFCNSPQMNAIEAYIEFTPGLITDDGKVTVQSTEEFLRNYMKEFRGFIERVYQAIPRTSGAFAQVDTAAD